MSNKVYKKKPKSINKTNENEEKLWQILMPFILMLVFFSIITFIPLPWSIYSPGGTIPLSDKLTEDGYESNGTISMTYMSFQNGRIANLLLALILPSWDIISNDEVTYEEQDLKETEERDRIEMYKAISDATLVAYQKANVEVLIEKNTFYVALVKDKESSNIRVGDIILSYDGKSMTTFADLEEYIKSKNIGDTVTFNVKRNNKKQIVESKIIALDGEKKIGISIVEVNNYNKNTITYKPTDDESGPSCGLMVTLAIYNSITEYDITKGKHICGTGTIDEEGNVGIIGGLKYKLIGSEKDKCDIFFIPNENKEEAEEIIKENNIDMNIHYISTFDEAINILIN